LENIRKDWRIKAHAALSRAVVEGGPATAAIFSRNADVAVSAPVETLAGADEVETRLLGPLRAAFEGLHRRDILFIGGPNRREEGGDWVASVTHYVGNFARPLFGIAPSQRLAFLRTGEFHRLDDGQIVTSRIILDLPDLMRQAGHRPFPGELGTEIVFPAPATQDGLFPQEGDGEASLDRVEAMIADLKDYDPATGASANQTGEGGHWRDDMLWYGPGGIGSNYRWDGFVKDHRRPFLTAFPDRVGGNHFCRIGDGHYAAFSGWPSMTMTHAGDYLGVPATGRPLTLRVMDFYRLSGGRIAENWVLLDYVDLFAQMGVDLLARSG
jgi:predicted ester cyclase